MSLNRYENLRRYLHLSVPEKPHSDDEENAELWWWRLDPIITLFHDGCRRYLIPGTAVAIDEIMVRFYGRSADTFKIPRKLIKQGYKIFALA